MFVPRTKSAMPFRSSFVATPPVGLWGELRKIALALGSVLDVTPGSAPLIGGQFGGNYPGLAGFALADGSARFFADRVNPLILQSMFTIAGRGEDPLIGE